MFASVSSGNNNRTDQLRNRHKAVLMKAKRTGQHNPNQPTTASRVSEDLDVIAPVDMISEAHVGIPCTNKLTFGQTKKTPAKKENIWTGKKRPTKEETDMESENPLFDFLDARAAEAVNARRAEIASKLFDSPEEASFVPDDTEEEEVTEAHDLGKPPKLKKAWHEKKKVSKKEREERDRADYEAAQRQNEEVEPVEELKKTTLASYVQSASLDLANRSFASGHQSASNTGKWLENRGKSGSSVSKKALKRVRGIVTATDKLAK
jgi:hypothetical protein